MDVNRLAKSPNEDLSDDEAKGSGNANDSIKIRPITYKDVQSATEKIYNGGINKTNLQYSDRMSELAGMKLFFKQEYTMPTGSFKERGVVNALLNLTEPQKHCGVIAASAGNHAQALAYHGKKLGIPVTVVMPIVSPITKLQRCKQFGAEVIIRGDDVVESKDNAMKISNETGKVYIHGYDDANILAGQGTIGIEVIDQMKDIGQPLDAIIVPVGGGGLIAGISVAVKQLSPDTEVIGVESDHCDAFKQSFDKKELVTVEAQSTLADGLAVSRLGTRSFMTASRHVDRVVTVSENEIAVAILRIVEILKTVVEGAAATGLAACLFGKLNHLRGKNVAVVLTGSNIDTPVLNRCLERGLVNDGRLVMFQVLITDRPGGLSELLKLLVQHNASVRDIFHERPWVQEDMYSVEVRCSVDTTGWKQSNQLKDALEKKYSKRISWGKDKVLMTSGTI
ncbi:L-threonine ammonia-lyase-like [Dysidea avara]|uniref:L-threonine ammonia-lyase-like n=1 Tax=Dysidea avara TaxID=196820 RepID=UPI00331A8684